MEFSERERLTVMKKPINFPFETEEEKRKEEEESDWYSKDIYKRYYRATSQSGGFGLGLNIVNMICKNYNIKIEAQSIENEETTFKLIF